MNNNIATVTGIAALAALVASGPAARADGMHWHGEVDDSATISIHKTQVDVDANKKGVRDEHHSFHGELHRGVMNVQLTHVRGRGRVWIAQQPNSGNHFTVVVRIKDPQDGAGKYDFDLEW